MKVRVYFDGCYYDPLSVNLVVSNDRIIEVTAIIPYTAGGRKMLDENDKYILCFDEEKIPENQHLSTGILRLTKLNNVRKLI